MIMKKNDNDENKCNESNNIQWNEENDEIW